MHWRKLTRKLAEPILTAIARRLPVTEISASTEIPEQYDTFQLTLMSVARAIAADRDFKVILPVDSARRYIDAKNMKIGFFGNIANNAYNFTKCLRRLGYDAELVIEDGWFDTFLMNRPFWEDVEVECASPEEGLSHEYKWKQPVYVHRVAYNPQMQMQFQGRYSAIPEVQTMYKQAFGIELPEDRALLLAQQMGHWPYLLAMKRYDVIQFSGAAISMGIFSPKPYVVFPTGSDLFISPFEETIFGLLARAAYRNASHLLVAETNYPEYLDRLDRRVPRSFAPLMIDTETYVPGDGEEVLAKWQQTIGGEKFLLNVCRQSWQWKGNDRLIHAFSTFTKKSHDNWRLVLMEWGADVDQTKELIRELGLESKILWEKLCSKPLLRKRQQAANIVVDQFVMEGYGTSVLESMAAAKPVIIRETHSNILSHLPRHPPFLGAASLDEINTVLSQVSEENFSQKVSHESLHWLQECHGYTSVYPIYVKAYSSVL